MVHRLTLLNLSGSQFVQISATSLHLVKFNELPLYCYINIEKGHYNIINVIRLRRREGGRQVGGRRAGASLPPAVEGSLGLHHRQHRYHALTERTTLIPLMSPPINLRHCS